MYQQNNVKALFNKYINADKVKIDYEEISLDENKVLFKIDLEKEKNNPELTRPNMYSEYLVIDLTYCDDLSMPPFPVTVAYDSTITYFEGNISHSYSRTFMVNPPSEPGNHFRIFMPVWHVNNAFRGIEMPTEAKRMLAGVYLLKDQSDFLLRLNIYLPEDWQKYTLYQTLDFETRRKINLSTNKGLK